MPARRAITGENELRGLAEVSPLAILEPLARGDTAEVPVHWTFLKRVWVKLSSEVPCGNSRTLSSCNSL